MNAGLRVLLEKPLTASVESDRSLSQFLDSHHPDALMLAFQRRFDAPLRHAKALLDAGRIGRPFKFVSILEDSNLMAPGYDSPGLLQDMSIHNIDEILWLSGSYPNRVQATGSRIYSHRLTEVEEDFDDALLQLWFPDEVIGQIQVSRNHVAGYRVETWVFGEQGVIHVGGFAQNPEEVVLEAYGRDAAIERLRFPLRRCAPGSPEFMAPLRKRLRVRIRSVREVLPFRNALPREPETRSPSDGGHRGQHGAYVGSRLSSRPNARPARLLER